MKTGGSWESQEAGRMAHALAREAEEEEKEET